MCKDSFCSSLLNLEPKLLHKRSPVNYFRGAITFLWRGIFRVMCELHGNCVACIQTQSSTTQAKSSQEAPIMLPDLNAPWMALPWGKDLFGSLIWSYCNLDFWPCPTTEPVNSEAVQHGAVSQLQTASSYKSTFLDISSAGVVLWRITHNKWLQSGITKREASPRCQVREEHFSVLQRGFRHDVPLFDRMLKKKQSLAWAEVDQTTSVCVPQEERPACSLSNTLNTPL